MPLIDTPQPNSKPENCRSCVDFKSWAKQQRKSLSTSEVNFYKNCEILMFSIIFLEKRCKESTCRA